MVPAVVVAGATALAAVMVSTLTGYPGKPSRATSLVVAFMIVAIAAFGRFMRYLYNLWKAGENRPIARIREDIRPSMMSYIPIIAGIAILSPFLYSITFLKSMITAVVPFWADDALARVDGLLGIDPQGMAMALQPALPALGLFYGLWHIANLGGIVWVLHWKNDGKGQMIVAYMLTWAIGMATAYAFSSAGPIFTGRFDPAIAPEFVRSPAAALWANYKSGGAMLGGGISAFPSLHVAIAVWLAIALRERGWAWIGIIYALGVFACSIILGWHYALDGVGGAIIALLANRLSGLLIRRASNQHGRAIAAATGASIA